MSPTPDFRLSRGWRLRSRSRLQAKAGAECFVPVGRKFRLVAQQDVRTCRTALLRPAPSSWTCSSRSCT
jgi:hypothetical protein